jgi:two-component system OmpR family response regulator
MLKENPEINLVILDVMMKGMDGISVCKAIRANPELQNMPVILLTAMSEENDRVLGLELGADDYLSKPFSPRELLARIRAVLRRFEYQGDGKKNSEHLSLPIYHFLGWRFETGTRTLFSPQNVEVSLTAKVYQLLLAFLESPQRVITRDQLMDIINNRECDPFDRSIDILVSRLRLKLEEDPKNPKLVKTVRSGGYMFATAVTKE